MSRRRRRRKNKKEDANAGDEDSKNEKEEEEEEEEEGKRINVAYCVTRKSWKACRKGVIMTSLINIRVSCAHCITSG